MSRISSVSIGLPTLYRRQLIMVWITPIPEPGSSTRDGHDGEQHQTAARAEVSRPTAASWVGYQHAPSETGGNLSPGQHDRADDREPTDRASASCRAARLV